jgi:excisionase family DNA binding protein
MTASSIPPAPKTAEGPAPAAAAVVTPLAYGPAEAAQLTGLSRARMYQLMKDGTVPSVKLGRRRLIRRQRLEELLVSLEERGF